MHVAVIVSVTAATSLIIVSTAGSLPDDTLNLGNSVR